MINKNQKLKIYLSLFTPSGIGIVLYTSLAGLIIFLHQFDAIKDYLQVPDTIELLPVIMRWLETLLTSSIGESQTQTLVVGLFWAVVGLGVYFFLQGVSRFILELTDTIGQRKYFWPKGTDRNRPIIEAVERSVFQIIAGLGLAFVLLGPLASSLDGPVWQAFLGPNQVLQLTVWFIVLWLLMHTAVVLLRLLVLKPRIFI